MRDVIIVGSGPAGFTAAIYAARADLAPLLVASSIAVGGELMKTTDVENFPGFPEGIMGPDLMNRMLEQAKRYGTDVVYDDVVELLVDGPVKRVVLGSGTVHEARTIIFATGSEPRKLGVDGESRLVGRGVSYCATCDGFFFRDRTIAVVGGGDSALEEAVFLTRFATKVHIVHRRGELRASKIMQQRALANPKIEISFDSEVAQVVGDEAVAGLVLRNTRDGSTRELPLDGVFVAIGNDPRTHLVHGHLTMTSHGTVQVDGRSSRTSVDGIFGAGDVVDERYRQAITAAASGAAAALDVEHYLSARSDLVTAGASRSTGLIGDGGDL